MATTTLARRQAHNNPIHPYSWEVLYRGGGRMKQFDFDGQHWTREVDLARVSSLRILGHPNSPIIIHLPYPEAPDEVIVKARNTVTFHTDSDVIERKVEKYIFGFRYKDMEWTLTIGGDGWVSSYGSEMVR